MITETAWTVLPLIAALLVARGLELLARAHREWDAVLGRGDRG